jgi:hypothetical protein
VAAAVLRMPDDRWDLRLRHRGSDRPVRARLQAQPEMAWIDPLAGITVNRGMVIVTSDRSVRR